MKHTEKFTAIPWLLDWGLALIVAAVGLIVFLSLARESKVWERIARGLTGGYYLYYSLWLFGRGFRETPTLFFVVPLYLGFAYFFGISGHKHDLARARRKVKAEADLQLWTYGPKETHWSPEPVVGYRITIHSFAGERFHHQPAVCRMDGYASGLRHHDPLVAPTWGCSCGYYAMKDHKRVPGEFKVVVLMWGTVIEHEDGYRASHMRPIGFYGHAPRISGNELTEVSTFNSPMRAFITPVADHNLCLGFQNLPVATDQKSLDAMIEKAFKEFDPEYIPPYDGGRNGYR
jgi:hypothetical protein